MKQGLFFLCLFILGLVCCLSSAHAIVYWNEDFETPLAGNWTYSGGYGPACMGSPCLYLDRSTPAYPYFHSGTHSLRLFYNTNQFDDKNNVAIVRSVPQTDLTLFTRFWYLTIGFTYPPDVSTSFKSVTTHFYQEDLGTGVVTLNFKPDPNDVTTVPVMAMAIQASEDCHSQSGLISDCYANWYATPNVTTVKLVDNLWYCIETETTMNSPGSANAVLQLWVNGTLTIHYTNFRLRGSADIGQNGNSSLSKINSIQIYKQYGTGSAYLDDFAVGTTRIGCGGSADTTPPETPFGLTIR